MHAALRPYLTTGVAIVGASVLLVSPVTVPSHDLGRAPSSAAVELAAATTTALPDLGLSIGDFATVALAVATANANIALFTAGVPAMAAEVLLAAALNPAATPELISYVAHRLLELPTATSTDVHSLLADAAKPIVDALAQVLPAPWGMTESDIGMVNTYFYAAATAVNALLQAQLGTPVTPGEVIQGVIDGIIGGIFGTKAAATADVPSLPDLSLSLEDIATIAGAVVTSQLNIATFQLGVPALAFKVALAAFLSPTSVPGLQSYIAHTLLELPTPTNLEVHSLLADAAKPIVDALASVLPAPFGASTTDPADIGVVRSAAFAVGSLVNQYLDTYGDPIDPQTVTDGIFGGLFGGIFGANAPATTSAPAQPEPELSDPGVATTSVHATGSKSPRRHTLTLTVAEPSAAVVSDTGIKKVGAKTSVKIAAAPGATKEAKIQSPKARSAQGNHRSE